MIKIENEIIKTQKNFWNQCLFHPTDAIEDPWGRRILDRISADKAIDTVRIYTMFEDIVYIGENGEICYDFRLSDLRLDYMVEKGFNLLLAYAGMPDCIASSSTQKATFSKGKTRYKGKLWNSAPPKDYAVWEEVCYEYTKHIVERYGIETVSKWRMQCFNEPDIPFFMSEYPSTLENALNHRLPAYCKLYEHFERGIKRVSEEIKVGGPTLAYQIDFLGGWLEYVKEKNLKMDFISVHNYGTSPSLLNSGERPFDVASIMAKHKKIVEMVKSKGFGDVPLLVDEWGMAAAGYYNIDECPSFIARENEVFSAYFGKMIHEFTYSDFKMEMLCICLSGQHEMVEDFSGFRNFFTLNFIAKPIYNSYILAGKLYENVLSAECGENCFIMPTKNDNGNLAVMVSYCSKNFTEDIPDVTEEMIFGEDIKGKQVTVWCIDKSTTNPYRKWENMGKPDMTDEVITQLKEEGKLKPIKEFTAENNSLTLNLTPNSLFLVTVE